MTDRDLLELAAKAVGREITGWDTHHHQDIAILDDGSYWQPLHKNWMTDCDGDALRLAVKLGLKIETPKYKGFGSTVSNNTVFRDCPYQQTREAIVRAAAEIGKAMP